MGERVNSSELISFYLRRWKTALIFIILGLLIASLYTFIFQKPLYESNVSLIVTNNNSSNSSSLDSQTLIGNSMAFMQSRLVLENAISKSNIEISYENLHSAITVENSSNSGFITLTVNTDSPHNSQTLANSVLKSFEEKYYTAFGKKQSALSTTIDSANLDKTPSNIDIAKQLIIGGSCGLIVALIVIFIFYDPYKPSGRNRKNIPVSQQSEQNYQNAVNGAIHNKTIYEETNHDFITPVTAQRQLNRMG